MTTGQSVDPRLHQALTLLRAVILDSGEGADEPWLDSNYAVSPGPDIVSSTDLLTIWPSLQPKSTDPINDRHFDNQPGPESPDRAPAAFAEDWVPDMRDHPGTGRTGDDREIDRAVDCLYDFLHALGRLDIPAALSFVSRDYHAVEQYRSIDYQGVQRQLEMLLDPYGDSQIEVSLAEIPDPVVHDEDVLIDTVIQIDVAADPGEQPLSTLIRRIVVLNRSSDDKWRISSLCNVGAFNEV